MGILWIIIVAIVALALLGFLSRAFWWGRRDGY